MLRAWQTLGCLVALLVSAAGSSSVQAQSKSSGPANRNGGRQSPQSSAKPAPAKPAAAKPSPSKPAATTASQAPTPAPALAPAPATTDQPAPAPQEKVVVSNTGSGETFALRHQLKQGDVVRTRTIHEANTVTSMQGTDDLSESRTVSDKVWEVKAVGPDGSMTFEYRIDSVDMSQKQGDSAAISYNSRTDKTAPDVWSKLSETIAKPIATITIDPSGLVVQRDQKSRAPALGMGELAIPFPKEPVGLGAQWSIPRECRVKLEKGTHKTIKIREQYTLEKVSAGVATIRVQCQAITPVEEPSVEAQLMQQLSRGTIKFDLDRGRLISKQLDWDESIVGFSGAETSLKYNARFTEEAIEETSAATKSASVKQTEPSTK